MHKTPFVETVMLLCANDPRFTPDAYMFVRESLDYTSRMLKKPADGPRRHVKGLELLEGIRRYALEQFGPMTVTVLASWGITETRDFGEIVFNLVDAGALGKSEEDSREDFDHGYDFHDAFAKPFLPPAVPEEEGEGSDRPPVPPRGRPTPEEDAE